MHESLCGFNHIEIGFFLKIPATGFHGIYIFNQGIVPVLILGETGISYLPVFDVTVMNVPAIGAVNTVVAVYRRVEADVEIFSAAATRSRAVEFEGFTRHILSYLNIIFRDAESIASLIILYA